MLQTYSSGCFFHIANLKITLQPRVCIRQALWHSPKDLQSSLARLGRGPEKGRMIGLEMVVFRGASVSRLGNH